MEQFLTITNLADILGVSIATVNSWAKKGKYTLETNKKGQKGFNIQQLKEIPEIAKIINSNWDEEYNVTPLRKYTSVELFAGAGGLAIGMEKAGFHHILLNEFDKVACNTLRTNRPNWNVLEGDIHNVSFKEYEGKVDFISGGFPCQAFSYAGNKGGFEDARGTLFFEMVRAVKEIKPKVFMGENVKGLFTHDNGKTLQVIRNTISELGYTLVEPEVLKAILYQVPQKRERLILIAIRNDIAEKVQFKFPSPYKRIMLLRDAFYKGVLYDTDVPESEGQKYPERKRQIMELVPEGGYWKDLPEDLQIEYMKGSSD